MFAQNGGIELIKRFIDALKIVMGFYSNVTNTLLLICILYPEKTQMGFCLGGVNVLTLGWDRGRPPRKVLLLLLDS